MVEDAGLGVGHIWTEVRCPAYRTLIGADCTCNQKEGADMPEHVCDEICQGRWSTCPPPALVHTGRRRSRLVVTIELDPVPGWGNSPADHVALVQRTLDGIVGHYRPMVDIDERECDDPRCTLCCHEEGSAHDITHHTFAP